MYFEIRLSQKLKFIVVNMITFGFRNKLGGVLRIVLALCIGIFMTVRPATSLTVVVKILATFVIASGAASAIYGFIKRRDGSLGLMLVNAVVDVLLGIILFSYPEQVAGFLIILIGIALMVLGLFQISALFSARNFVSVGILAFILPALSAAGGFLLLFKPFGVASFITVIAGVALIIYALSELLAIWKMNRAIKEYEIRFEPGAGGRPSGTASSRFDGAKDVDFEKVDDKKKQE